MVTSHDGQGSICSIRSTVPLSTSCWGTQAGRGLLPAAHRHVAGHIVQDAEPGLWLLLCYYALL